MSSWQQDLSYTFRRLVRMPGVVFAIVISIGLGVGANGTIFSMVSRFVLRSAPVGGPTSLLTLHTLHDGDQCCNAFPWPLFQDLNQDVRDGSHSFSGVAAYYELIPASIAGNGEPARVWGQSASANFFDVAQVPMAAGRGFVSEEENSPVMVMSYRMWQRRFDSDPRIAGRVVSVSGHPFTVVGVAAPGFRGLDLVLDPEFWVPLGNTEALVATLPARSERNAHWLQVAARLKPGVSRTQAAADLDSLAKRLARAYPATDKGNGFRFEQAGSLPPRDKPAILMFLAALSAVVLLVLCIACVNVASLLLAQVAGRQREMAVRLALGATRTRLARQMILESVILSLTGGGLGLLLSLAATRALASFRLPAPVPLDLTLSVDWHVVAYSLGLSLVAGFAFGMIPAWASARPMLVRALKGEDALARPGRRWTLRNTLLVLQIAMTLVLLTATGLFLRSLASAASIDVGFRSTGSISLNIDPRLQGYSAHRTAQFFQQLRQQVKTIPGVTSVVCTDSLPLSGGHRSDGFQVEGGATQGYPIVELYAVTPGYFAAMGIPQLSGRDFSEGSSSTVNGAVVSQAFVHQFFGNVNPIGQFVNGGGVRYQILGVVGDIKSRTLGEETRPVLFRSLEQTIGYDPSFTGYSIVVRSALPAATLARSVKEKVRLLDPGMAVDHLETIEDHMRDAFFLPRLAASLFGVFGGIGLTLAIVGLYGAMSYSVSRRTREIGIRMALGAQAGKVQRLILRQGLLLAGIAVGMGLPAALALSRVLGSFLYGVQSSDPLTFALAPALLLLIALAACWIPARRAARVDPQIVLRYE